MGSFLVSFGITTGVMALLFFPIYLEVDAHVDITRKIFAFAVYAYGVLKVYGGYATSYQGGVALHVNEDKAVLLPYSNMESERKKLAVYRAFHIKRFSVATETGAEYLLMVSLAHTGLKTFFQTVLGERVKSGLWLTDGDVLKVSTNLLLWFNLFIILKLFIKFIKEKIKSVCRKKTKKSTI